ncbi:GNAT family N-acetyltransferase [Limnoglobus roseus]|uniref:N-acetyltransferase n=1 Tax=Limnoglobus roseus TaxID=2598579 RepID=A0A5C1A805_9BACT|nr:GNAT family N-acetyltransferase [Limnoglobus roseus]QEL15331.1 N-acetyltransferase [Limnoglobus roseus]
MPFIATPASADERPQACRVLFAHTAFADLAADRFQEMISRGELDPAGLIVAKAGGTICGAIFAYRIGGGQAAIWLPSATDVKMQDVLVAGVVDWIRREPTNVIQAIVRQAELPRTPPLVRAGFQNVTRLVFLTREASPCQSPRGRLQFHAETVVTPSFAELLTRTYDGTLDVPELNGRRTGEDILAGYLAACESHPPQWWWVERDGESVGVLLLSPTDDPRTTELTYLGLVPEFRGQGLGREVLRFALAAAGRRSVCLNVDERNEPALRLYRAANFYEFDRREVFLLFP